MDYRAVDPTRCGTFRRVFYSLMQLITATLIKHDLPDSTAQIVQAAIIVLAVYLQRSRAQGGVA